MMFEILSYVALLVTGVIVYWRGRRVLRHLDDPSLPELHLAKQQADGTTLAIGLVAAILLDGSLSGLKLLLIYVITQLAAFPYRKTLFRETRRWPAFLSFQVRFSAMAFGPLVLLASFPGLARWAGEHALPTALLLAVLCMLWVHRHPVVSRWLVSARPIEHPELEERFTAVAMKAKCRPPAVWRFGPRGGFLVNAFALASLYRPGVLMTDDLLESFGPRETTAIFAHELAHLEESTRRKRLLGELWHLAQLVLGVLLVVFWGPGDPVGDSLQWLWALAVVVLALRQKRSREAEHRCDLRGAELSGDPQALIDGLRKIHMLNNQPRRWNPSVAAQLTHPSLAQRLRAIREAAITAGVEGPTEDIARTPETRENETTLEPCVLVAGKAGEVVVVLTGEHVHWLRSVPRGTPLLAEPLLAAAGERKTVALDDLLDLRHEVKGLAKRHLLVAMRRGERPLSTPIGAADVPRLVGFLARIEHRLASTAPGSEAPESHSLGSWTWRLYGFLIALLALLPFSGTLALAGLAVVVFPGLAAVAATGILAVATTIESLLVDYGGALPEEHLLTLNLLLRAAWGLYMLWHVAQRYRRGDVDPPWTPLIIAFPLAGLGFFSALAGAARLAAPHPYFQLHRWSAGGPMLPLVLLALAAVLLTRRRRVSHGLALGMVLLALAAWLPASRWFLGHYGDDPLSTTGLDGVALASLEVPALETVRSLERDDHVLAIELSSTGRLLLQESLPYDEFEGDWSEEGAWMARYQAELAEGTFYPVEAFAATWLADDRLLLLGPGQAGLELIVRSLVPTPESDTVLTLPELSQPELRLAADRESWRVTGIEDDEERELVVIWGDWSGRPPRLERWAMPGESFDFSTPRVTPSGALRVTVEFMDDFDMAAVWLAMFTQESAGSHTVERLERADTENPAAGPTGALFTTPRSVDCLPGPADAPRLACLAWLDDRTQLIWLDPAASTVATMVEPVAAFEGYLSPGEHLADGRLVLSTDGGSMLIFDLATGIAHQLGPQLDGESPEDEPPAEPAPTGGSGWFDDMIVDWENTAWVSAVGITGDHLAIARYRPTGGTEITVLRRGESVSNGL